MEQDPKSSAPVARRSPARASRQSSAGELREFLATLQDKDPNQVMVGVKESSLTHGMVLATLATIVLLLACTAGPYVWETSFGPHSGDKVAATAKIEPAASGESNPAEKAPSAAATTAPANEQTAKSGGKQALNKNVLDEVSDVKQSDPNTNPLESKIDDLFDRAR